MLIIPVNYINKTNNNSNNNIIYIFFLLYINMNETKIYVKLD